MADSLLEALERKRPGYEEELVWHRFLMDAYLGTGGFAGMVKPMAYGAWGAGAEVYSSQALRSGVVSLDTYLDRFPREDGAKFSARVAGTQYDNYVEPLTDLKVAYILRKEFEPRGLIERVAAWRQNVDGRGTTWHELRANNAIVAAVLGWRPVLIDAREMPVAEDGSPIIRNAAQAAEVGMAPYPVPLFPANLYDYETDDAGEFSYAKLCTMSMRQESWRSAREEVRQYTIWTPDEYEKYEVVKRDGRDIVVSESSGPNPFGVVPLAIVRHKANPQDPVRGMPMHAGVSQAARAHLNRLSEFNEHLRGQVFAVLVYASKGAQIPEDVTIGTDNALAVDSEGSQTHAYIAPPASVATTYEKRLEAIVREMYRMARVEFTRASGGITSGDSHAYEFQQTNAALGDFAQNIAKAEDAVDYIVGRYHGASEDELNGQINVPPKSFDIENMQADIKASFDLIGGDIGPTATRMIKSRLVKQALPMLSAEDAEVIEQELRDEQAQDDADDAMAEEARAALLERGTRRPGDNDEEPDDGQESATP